MEKLCLFLWLMFTFTISKGQPVLLPSFSMEVIGNQQINPGGVVLGRPHLVVFWGDTREEISILSDYLWSNRNAWKKNYNARIVAVTTRNGRDELMPGETMGDSIITFYDKDRKMIGELLSATGTQPTSGNYVFFINNSGEVAAYMKDVNAVKGTAQEAIFLANLEKIKTKNRPKQPGEPLLDGEGNQYPTLWLGNRLWMEGNLRVTTFRNGDPIPEARNDREWIEAYQNKQPAFCYYLDEIDTAEEYGVIYNYYAIKDSRGLLPDGWHIPTIEDWCHLYSIPADYLKEVASQSFLRGPRRYANLENPYGLEEDWWGVPGASHLETTVLSLYKQRMRVFHFESAEALKRGGRPALFQGLPLRAVKD